MVSDVGRIPCPNTFDSNPKSPRQVLQGETIAPLADVLALVDQVVKQHAVDDNRLYRTS
ncbi:MAG TPA: hypothetical protein VNQ76_18405 [Planctomicrobium sp.]|nr:hypothetical protein [Planctomicrobium sp.]